MIDRVEMPEETFGSTVVAEVLGHPYADWSISRNSVLDTPAADGTYPRPASPAGMSAGVPTPEMVFPTTYRIKLGQRTRNPLLGL